MPMMASDIYGTSPIIPGPVLAPTAISATDNQPAGWRGLLNPRNPLFWLGAVAVVSVGAAGLAGSVRLGPAKLTGQLGKA